MKKLLAIVLLVLLGSGSLFAQFGATGTTSVQVTIAPEAAIRIDTATTTLTNAGIFSDFTGTTNFTYKIQDQFTSH